MRITYAGNFEWPSEQARAIQSVHTGHALACLGAHLRFVTMRSPTSATPVEALARYGLSPHARFRSRAVPVVRIPEALRFIEIHKRLAITNLSYCAGAALDALAAPPGQRPDWVFTRDPRVAWAFIKLRPLLHARVVYEVHELFGTRPRDNQSLDSAEQWGVADRTRRLEHAVLTGADRLLTLTGACKRLIIDSHAVPESRIRVVPDGTRQLPELPRLPHAERTIVYVGQLYRWKGVDTLVRALRLIPDGRLTVVGAGVMEHNRDVDRERLQALARELGIEHRVTLRNFIPYHEVPAVLAGAAVATVPLPDVLMSRYFTSPLKIFDAMAAGVPIVASDLDSIREVIRDGENGILVAPDSPQALAAGIQRVLDDPALAIKLAETARREVTQYTWEARAQAILECLDDDPS